MQFHKSLMVIFLVVFALITHQTQAQNSHQDFVAAHNQARAEVGVGPITWNDTVAAYAQAYADERIKDCALAHSGGPYGENIAEGYGAFSGTEAVELWVGEKPYYDYKSNSCVGNECRHYTQVVWGNSVHLGCGRVNCDNGWAFIVCNYDPPGNYIGERPYNSSLALGVPTSS